MQDSRIPVWHFRTDVSSPSSHSVVLWDPETKSMSAVMCHCPVYSNSVLPLLAVLLPGDQMFCSHVFIFSLGQSGPASVRSIQIHLPYHTGRPCFYPQYLKHDTNLCARVSKALSVYSYGKDSPATNSFSCMLEIKLKQAKTKTKTNHLVNIVETN